MNYITREIGYTEVAETTDREIMFNYAIQGVMDNDKINDFERVGNQAEWQDGSHIAEVYLDHCEHAVPVEVTRELDRWLKATSAGRDYFA